MEKQTIKKEKLTISLVIPVYNNEDTVINQLLACEKIVKSFSKNYEILIADDNSFDSTHAKLKKHFGKNKKIHLIFNKKNLGITKNIRMLYAKAANKYVLFYSADGDWNPQDTQKLLTTNIKNNADMVVGFREKKGGYNAYRRFVSFMHNLLPRLLFGVDTVDAGGIKLFKKELYSDKLISQGQFFEAEMIIRAINAGKKVSFIPVHYKKPPMKPGLGGNYASVFNAMQDVIRLWLYY